ncbi:IQ calmodulin-binding motif-containing protein 1 isoform X3 [Fundulus heteroclitus]|uniref:IQ calmodulin-binding motif-containing protein 1 isoform X3 n=1 Tax=Fundulus heteroclitus TaxID=8078 RepID=UPI00165AAE05|nr:IQ calmodulin-binding motif-containing protein 1 isoform X3 [Fundulus heteroclitus]
MELLEEEEAAIPELKRQLETEDLGPEEKISLLNDALNKVLNSAAVQADSAALTRVKSQLYLSGVLGQCVRVLPLGRNWTSAATLAHLTSCSCVGAEPGSRSEAFHRLFLPSVMDALLSLANQLMSRAECSALFRKVMDSVGWLLSAHTHLTDQVLSSVRYEQIQMCEDVTVSLLCIQMWIQTCTVNRDFLSRLSDESVLLLLNEAVGQLALSSDSAVGGASVRLMLLMARQLGLRLQSLLLNFKGLDSLLEKDWTGRGFDQEVGQLISILQRDGAGSSESEVRFGLTRKIKEVSAERLRAACLIQAAWRSYRTRRRVKGLNRAVSTLQRRYRARRRRLQEQREAQQWEEQLSYQVCVRRQRARRRFHQKQRELLLLLPPDQVRPYLQECERRAAVAIQSAWRGFRERRRYKGAPGDALRESQRRQRAARTLQRAGRRLLEKRRAAKAPPLTPPWIGQDGLTESRRAELKQQVDEHVAVHRRPRPFRLSR